MQYIYTKCDWVNSSIFFNSKDLWDLEQIKFLTIIWKSYSKIFSVLGSLKEQEKKHWVFHKERPRNVLRSNSMISNMWLGSELIVIA